MNCPNCGTVEKSRVRICPNCKSYYASEDLLELRQLEFLLEETASWSGTASLRKPYVEKLDSLLKRLLAPGFERPPTEELAQKVMEQPAVLPELKPPVLSAAPPKQARKETQPFDQWLLSERNIRFALYSGGLLLVIAGLIFVGVNWRWLPGLLKFAITLLITGSMYLGGYLLFRRPNFRLGGVALLGVSSGFFPLNFVVLQLYIFSSFDLGNDQMWLVGSLFAILFYLLTAYWTRAELFTCFSIVAAASAVNAIGVLLDLPIRAYLLVYAVLALVFLLIAYFLRPRSATKYLYLPLQVVAHLATPVLFLASILAWGDTRSFTKFSNPWWLLAAMLVCGIFYIFTDIAYGQRMARWAASGIVGFTSVLIVIELDFSSTTGDFLLMALAFAFLLVGYALQRKLGQPQHSWPLYATGYALAAFVTLQTLWAFGKAPVRLAQVLLIDVFVLAASAVFHRRIEWLYASAWVFMAPVAIYSDLYLIATTSNLILMILALAYLMAGYFVERRMGQSRNGWPLYAAGYTLASFVTVLASVVFGWAPDRLPQVLLGDVLLLAVSARLHRQREWACAAVWLFMAPVAIYADLYLKNNMEVGVALGVLMLVYFAVSYFLVHSSRLMSLAFLSAAALLSIVVVPLVWTVPLIATTTLAIISVCYLLIALKSGIHWLVIPVLVAIYLAVISTFEVFTTLDAAAMRPLTIAYAALGIALSLGGYRLQRLEKMRWAWPLFAFALLDLAGTYLTALDLSGWIAILLSAVYALQVFWFAWAEKDTRLFSRFAPVFVYLGIAFLFVGHFYWIDFAQLAQIMWPTYTVEFCAGIIALSWLARRGELARIYGDAFHRSGLVLMLAPLLGATAVSSQWFMENIRYGTGSAYVIANAILPIFTFTIGGVFYTVDAFIRRNLSYGYAAAVVFLVDYWYILGYLAVSEQQAFFLPLGLALLFSGWIERRRARIPFYRLTTLAGLFVLMGSAFYQSLSGLLYAGLLLLESLLALGWGIRTHSRIYVQAAVLALLANAVAQLGPAFIELPRWAEIGIIGSLLLGGGLFALFRRDQIMVARRNVADEWKQWQP